MNSEVYWLAAPADYSTKIIYWWYCLTDSARWLVTSLTGHWNSDHFWYWSRLLTGSNNHWSDTHADFPVRVINCWHSLTDSTRWRVTRWIVKPLVWSSLMTGQGNNWWKPNSQTSLVTLVTGQGNLLTSSCLIADWLNYKSGHNWWFVVVT